MTAMLAPLVVGAYLVQSSVHGQVISNVYRVMIGISGVGVSIWFLFGGLYRLIFPRSRIQKIADANGVKFRYYASPNEISWTEIESFDLTPSPIRSGETLLVARMRDAAKVALQLKTSTISPKLPFATLESSRSLDVFLLKQALVDLRHGVFS